MHVWSGQHSARLSDGGAPGRKGVRMTQVDYSKGDPWDDHTDTDDFGYKAVEKRTHVHDLHATILYLMGIDHTKLTYRYSGRDFLLTDTAGEVRHNIIA